MQSRLLATKVGEGHTGMIAQTGKPLFVADYQNSPYRIADLPETEWIVSLGGVPLISKEKLLGVLVVATSSLHEFGESEQKLLESVGRSIGVAIDNACLFDDVARGKKEWETTFDAMTSGVSIHDLDFNIIRANSSLDRMLGTTTAALIGKKCYAVFHCMASPLAA